MRTLRFQIGRRTGDISHLDARLWDEMFHATLMLVMLAVGWRSFVRLGAVYARLFIIGCGCCECEARFLRTQRE